MRYIQVFGSCFVVALFATACRQQNVTKDVDRAEPAEVAQAAGSSTLDANTVLADALALAKSDDKNVFVHLGAPW